MEASWTAYLPLPFTKLHGLGNCYLYIDVRDRPLPEEILPELARRMADRGFGIGADGIILIDHSEQAPFRMRIFNSDGSEAEMCGNGIRGFAKYLYDRGQAGSDQSVETLAGVLHTRVVREEGGVARAIAVDMGRPVLTRGAIPMHGEPLHQAVDMPLSAAGTNLLLTAVSMGNPHVVHFVSALWDRAETARVGEAVEHHPWFPRRVNFHVAEVVHPQLVRVRHWERGAGLTNACGTGACAVLVAGVLSGRLDRDAEVEVPGGSLHITWAKNDHVMMTGPAEQVCEGVFDIA